LEALDLRRTGFSPVFTLLMPAFALAYSITRAYALGFISKQRSPTARIAKQYEPVASVLSLAPLNLWRTLSRPVSYYALFKG